MNNHHRIPLRLVEETLALVNPGLHKRMPPGIMGAVCATDSLEEGARVFMKELFGVPGRVQFILTSEPIKNSIGQKLNASYDMVNAEGTSIAQLASEYIFRPDGGPLVLSHLSAMIPPEMRPAGSPPAKNAFECWFPFTSGIMKEGGRSAGYRSEPKWRGWRMLDDVIIHHMNSVAFDTDSVKFMDHLRYGIKTLA